MGLSISDDALHQIIQLSGGDARRCLNLLEFCAETVSESGKKEIDVELVTEASQRKTLLYDKSGEEHFNLISALHKSMRASDVDASLYWLMRMLDAGEDPRYIVRRVIDSRWRTWDWPIPGQYSWRWRPKIHICFWDRRKGSWPSCRR
jgi:putative ATPase